jgi:hypothetical protein
MCGRHTYTPVQVGVGVFAVMIVAAPLITAPLSKYQQYRGWRLTKLPHARIAKR